MQADVEPDEPVRPPPPPTWTEIRDRLLGDRRRLVALAVGVLFAAGAGLAGYALLRTPPAPAAELGLPFAGAGGATSAPAAPSVSTTTEPTTVVVHAAGGVAVPGLHSVPAGSRVADVLAAAGGPAPDADLDRVNLAAPVVDGERVWFPRIGEAAAPAAVGGGGGASAGGGAAAPAGPLDLNTATAEQLDELPGIGPSIAAAIVEHRERVGPFATVDDLLDVPGIGDAKLAQLRDLVTV
jgi:competence protein ComEA